MGYSPGGGNRQSPSSRPGSPGDSGAPAETITPLFTIGTGGSSPDQNVAIGQATDVTSVNASDLGTQPTFPNPPVVNNGETSGGLTSATQQYQSAGSVFTGQSIQVAQSTDAPIGNLSDAGKLTLNEQVAIDKLDEFHEIAVANGDRFERGVIVSNGKVLDTFIGNPRYPEGDPSNVEFSVPPHNDPIILGHTHELPGSINEEFSTGDRYSLLQHNRGDKILLRTPTGAIRSMKRPLDGGTRIRETLKGEPIDYYPLRE